MRRQQSPNGVDDAKPHVIRLTPDLIMVLTLLERGS